MAVHPGDRLDRVETRVVFIEYSWHSLLSLMRPQLPYASVVVDTSIHLQVTQLDISMALQVPSVCGRRRLQVLRSDIATKGTLLQVR